jgi:uncharacterized membrane protein YqjE
MSQPVGGLGASLQGLGATLSAILHNRMALLALDLEEERTRVLAVLAWGAVGVLMGSVALVCAAAFVTVLFWDTHRVLVLGLISAGFTALCVLAICQARAWMAGGAGLLSATMAELDADRSTLAAAPRGAQEHP